MNINIKIEYFLYIYCLPSETLIQSRASLLTAFLSNLYCKVDKFYDHPWQVYMSRLTFLSFFRRRWESFLYLWPLHFVILCTYWVNVRMWEYLCPTKYLNTWPLSAAPGHLLPLPSQRGRARVQQTRRRWDMRQPPSWQPCLSRSSWQELFNLDINTVKNTRKQTSF